MFWQQVVNAIWLGAVYSLFALGYTLVFGVLGMLNLAHPSLYMWGALIGLVMGQCSSSAHLDCFTSGHDL